jgi:hypothetical protein
VTETAPSIGKAEISNEAQALSDILAWSASSASWQRDALRRLCLEDQIDLDALLQLCKGLSESAVPLAPEHTGDVKAATAVVKLHAIHSVENVNALAEGERLTFANQALPLSTATMAPANQVVSACSKKSAVPVLPKTRKSSRISMQPKQGRRELS